MLFNYNSIRKGIKPAHLLCFLFVISIIANISMNYAYGTFAPLPANDSAFYIEHAKVFINEGFSGLAKSLPAYYWGYPIFLGLLIIIFGENFALTAILCQILFISLTSITVYKLGKTLFSIRAGLFAACLYVLTWEIFRWAHFILTDGLYIALFINIIYFWVIYNKTNLRIYLFILIALIILIASMRPTAIPLIAAVVILLIVELWKKRNYAFLFISFFAIPICLYLLITLGKTSTGDEFSLIWFTNFFTSRMAQGQVISGYKPYDVIFQGELELAPAIAKVQYYLALISKRILYFWALYIKPHSILHKTYNVLWLTPLFGFGLYGLIKSIKAKIRTHHILWVVLLIYTLFHAFTNIDFDQRYRAPLLSIVTVYSGYGISCFFSYLLDIYYNYNKRRANQ